MNVMEQLAVLRGIGSRSAFADRIDVLRSGPLAAAGVDILQVNVGKRCNLSCRHCHVEAGPGREEVMTRGIMEKCLAVMRTTGISTLDITGGSPEMNPHLAWFLGEAAALRRRLIVRSNLAILLKKEYGHFIDEYAGNRVEVVTSLPDYIEGKSDRQRGAGVFSKVITVMRELNRRGYGEEGSGLMLNVVHNPAGAYLPGSQAVLEGEYRRRLADEHGVRFNSLFCITNVPIGRYLEYLLASGNFEDYLAELSGAYNPAAVENVMCRKTVSVGWDGMLYDCDFNQMLDLPVGHGAPDHIDEFDIERIGNRKIVIGNHCYGCTAGAGSSCQGATVNNSEG